MQCSSSWLMSVFNAQMMSPHKARGEWRNILRQQILVLPVSEFGDISFSSSGRERPRPKPAPFGEHNEAGR